MMVIEDITAKALEGKIDVAFEELSKLPPSKMNDFYNCIKEKGKDLYDDIIDKLSDEQYKVFKWLQSSEREKEYLMSKPYEELDEQDLNNLRACDF